MAQYLALCKRNYEGYSEADFEPLLEPEAQALRTLYAAGSVRAAYGRKDVPGAVLLLEAHDITAARSAVDSLPLAAKGMLLVELIEIGPYRGFGPRT